jgi:hypothetical protein
MTDREAFVFRTRLMHLFRGFAELDSELPADLAPLSGRARGPQTSSRRSTPDSRRPGSGTSTR